MLRLAPTAAGGRTVLALAALLTLAGSRLAADTSKAEPVKKDAPALPAGIIPAQAWKAAPATPLQPGEIDALLDREMKKAGVRPAPLTTDEQFLRRVSLDLTGKLPAPADVTAFLADRSSDRRAKLIDRLLDSPEFASHWARYWREVISSRTTDFRGRIFARGFEKWLAGQLQKDASWADIARAMLTAGGQMRFDDPDKNAVGYFLASRTGADAVPERAAETSRVFLGIQIQCAQCHDHPSDVWKREQFHQLAAYYARLRDRFMFEEKRIVGVTLTSLPFGEHRLSDSNNPKGGKMVSPRFLDGKAPSGRLNDAQRRRALADAVTAKDNHWFAAAYVNRVWGELMGQSFYMPVDDMGPQKEAVFPTVLPRLAAAFRGSDYDTKTFFRAVLNSQAYQRQIRLGAAPDEHLLFAGNYPTRLRADALWNSLVGVLGQMGGGGPGGFRGKGPGFGRGGLFGFEAVFKQEFSFDPSSRPEDVEGSIAQALMLMNSPLVNQKVQARPANLLGQVLKDHARNEDAVQAVYLRTLARRPSERELRRCLDHIRTATTRAEAFEDILWALINSSEFQTRR